MSGDPSPFRIMAVDDHPLLRQGIVGLVADQSDMKMVAEASNGREAIQQFRTHRPDITLMDVQMPEMNGVDAMVACCRQRTFSDVSRAGRRGATSRASNSSRRDTQYCAGVVTKCFPPRTGRTYRDGNNLWRISASTLSRRWKGH
jgi:CheY-like chemotaxis protein